MRTVLSMDQVIRCFIPRSTMLFLQGKRPTKNRIPLLRRNPSRSVPEFSLLREKKMCSQKGDEMFIMFILLLALGRRVVQQIWLRTNRPWRKRGEVAKRWAAEKNETSFTKDAKIGSQLSQQMNKHPGRKSLYLLLCHLRLEFLQSSLLGKSMN